MRTQQADASLSRLVRRNNKPQWQLEGSTGQDQFVLNCETPEHECRPTNQQARRLEEQERKGLIQEQSSRVQTARSRGPCSPSAEAVGGPRSDEGTYGVLEPGARETSAPGGL